MSLVVIDGIPIPTHFEIPADLQAALPRPQIDIPRFPQESDAWCYAACAARVIKHSIPEKQIRQCEIVEFVKKPAHCCPVSSADLKCIDSGCRKTQIKQIFTEWNVSSKAVGVSISFSKVKTEVNARRLIEAVIDWDGIPGQQSSHAVLISGFIDDLEMIFVIDPLSPPDYHKWHTHIHVASGFGHGVWQNTWLNLKRKP